MYDTSELAKPILIYNLFIFIRVFGWGVLYDTFIQCDTIANSYNITHFLYIHTTLHNVTSYYINMR